MSKILVIGYGNPLRGDDGLGREAALQLAQIFREEPDVSVLSLHQLAPELAEDISNAQFVLFIDAALLNAPGAIVRTTLHAEDAPAPMTHAVTPQQLLSAASQLYGQAPEAIGLTLSGKSFAFGQPLSPDVSRRMPDLLGIATGLIRACQAVPQMVG
jgi:hydrogenase maturation protease